MGFIRSGIINILAKQSKNHFLILWLFLFLNLMKSDRNDISDRTHNQFILIREQNTL